MNEGRRRARRCAMCGIVNRPSTTRCQCGHQFDDDTASRGFLVARHRMGWFTVIAGLVSTLGSAWLAVFGGWLAILAIFATVPSVALFVKGTRIVDAARQGLRELPTVPPAKLLR